MGKPVNRHKWPDGLGGRSFPPAEVRGDILPKRGAQGGRAFAEEGVLRNMKACT